MVKYIRGSFWCPALDLLIYCTFHTYRSERSPAHKLYPQALRMNQEKLAEITNPKSLIRCIIALVRIVSKSTADVGVFFVGQDFVMAFVFIIHM